MVPLSSEGRCQKRGKGSENATSSKTTNLSLDDHKGSKSKSATSVKRRTCQVGPVGGKVLSCVRPIWAQRSALSTQGPCVETLKV